MLGLYDRFTTAVLQLVQPYSSTDKAPFSDAWRYLKSHLPPLRNVLILSLVVTVIASYAGTLIDTLAVTPREDIIQTHGFELLVAAAILLLFRPLSQLLRHATNDIGLDCNIATLVRWRAHDLSVP